MDACHRMCIVLYKLEFYNLFIHISLYIRFVHLMFEPVCVLSMFSSSPLEH